MTEQPKKRPFEYWLAEANRHVTEHGAAPLAAAGLSQLHWQVLNLICDENASSESIASTLTSVAPPGTIESAVNDLIDRGWVARDPDRLQATEAGQAQKLLLADQLTAIHKKALDGVAAQDYVNTVLTLKRIVQNLS